ncbi:uncharacterized protein [Argopecten irradians]|uniref:uncharacterized protein n=1 Tax=Argopecten irradians TaxID=31199 RepID=UPI00371C3AEC
MTDFQDLDILSLINDRPGWEIGMEDEDDLDIADEHGANQLPNCFASDGNLQNQPFANSTIDSCNNSTQQDNGDVTDEYGDNSDRSDENNDSEGDSNKISSDEEDANDDNSDNDSIKNNSMEEVANDDDEIDDDEEEDDKASRYSSDEEIEKSDNDRSNNEIDSDEEGGEEVDNDNDIRSNSENEDADDCDTEVENDVKNEKRNDMAEEEEEEEEEDTYDENSVTSLHDKAETQEQQGGNDFLSDVSDTDLAIDGSDKEADKENEEENKLYDSNDVIVLKLSDISEDESEKNHFTDNESDTEEQSDTGAGNAIEDISDDEMTEDHLPHQQEDNLDDGDASSNGENISVHDDDQVNNKGDDNSVGDIDEKEDDEEHQNKGVESDALSDLSMDVTTHDNEVEEGICTDDENSSLADEHDGDGDIEWSDADENENTNNFIKDLVDKLGESDQECPRGPREENDCSGKEKHTIDDTLTSATLTDQSDNKTENDDTVEASDSPFGFVIGDVVGVTQEEFDRQDSNVSLGTSLQQQSQENANENDVSNTQKIEGQETSMEVEMTTPSVYPRIESYHSENYYFGNAQIKQEPMDDDDYIQEHDYFDHSSTLDTAEADSTEIGLDADELLSYQDMYDITELGLYKCKYCSARLTTFKAVKAHINKCHQNGYKCQQCGEVFSRSQDLAGHCRSHRKEERELKEALGKQGEATACKQSRYRPKNKNTFVEKDGQRLYKCRFCEKKFDMTQKLANHMQWKHKAERALEMKLEKKTDEKIPVTVSLCGAKMTIKIDNDDKSIIHRKTPVYQNTYQCMHCSEVFTKQQTMAVHVRNRHPRHDKDDKPKVSEKSPSRMKKKTKKKNKRKRQLSEKKTKEERMDKDTCTVPEEVVSPPKKIKLEYTVQRPSLKCKLCSKTFELHNELKSHLNGVHAQYCCRYCPKAFYKLEKFMCHSFEHLGDLRCYVDEAGQAMMKCRKCKISLLAKGDVTIKHVYSHIKGKTPLGQTLSLEKQIFLECNTCGQPFISREYLLKHEMKHVISLAKEAKSKPETQPVADSDARASSKSNQCSSEVVVNAKPNSPEAVVTVKNVSPEAVVNGKHSRPDPVVKEKNNAISTSKTTHKNIEMVAHPIVREASKPCGSNGGSKIDENKKVLLRSNPVSSEMISVAKIPFKCGMCEARFPNSQYLLHHMTLHMNGQYVFKIEVDKKKDEIPSGTESSEPSDIANVKTTAAPTQKPTSGSEMASSIVKQLSSGSNMGSIINNNIPLDNGAVVNSANSNTDHTYTSKSKQPNASSEEKQPCTSKPSTCAVGSTSSIAPPVKKKYIILPTRPVFNIPGSTKSATSLSSSTKPALIIPNSKNSIVSIANAKQCTRITPTTTKKLQEMLNKKEQMPTRIEQKPTKNENIPAKNEQIPANNQQVPIRKEQVSTKSVLPNLEVLKLPAVGSMSPKQRNEESASDPTAAYKAVVESKIRELLELNKCTFKAGPSSVGVQTRYTSLISKKTPVEPKSTESTVSTEASSTQYQEEPRNDETTTNETTASELCSGDDSMDIHNVPSSSSTQLVSNEYSDTETLSAYSGSPAGTPGSQSPVVGVSSDSDSYDLSEDEKALFEETTTSVTIPLPSEELKQETQNESKAIKKEFNPPTSKVSIRNYKNQLDFAQGSWFECELCMYLCRTYKEFTSHMDSHKKSKRMRLVKCSVCRRKFISKWHLTKHMENHRDNAYSCSKCGANFVTAVEVMEHMQIPCSRFHAS